MKEPRTPALFALLLIAVLITALPGQREKPVEDKPPTAPAPLAEMEYEPLLEEPDDEAFVPCDLPLCIRLQEYTASECAAAVPPVPFEMALAVMEHESGFDPGAVSPTDDYGLMQVNAINRERMADELEVTDLLDPEQNIRAGVYILSEAIEAAPDLEGALMVYNHGPTGARRKWEQGITSTEFSQDILTRMDELLNEREEAYAGQSVMPLAGSADVSALRPGGIH